MQKTLADEANRAAPRDSGGAPATRPVKHAAGDAYDRIFLAAESLFAHFGYEGVSVRDIVQAAGISLAAVNYHFGSKHELLLAIFVKRARELSRARAELLRAAELAHRGAPPLEAVLRTFIAPPILWRSPASGKATAIEFLTRIGAAPTPGLQVLMASRVTALELFREALARAAPQASSAELAWALHFVAAISYHGTDLNLKRLAAVSQVEYGAADLEAAIDRAVRFAAAGVAGLCGPQRVSAPGEI